jgi:hypothetical protein
LSVNQILDHGGHITTANGRVIAYDKLHAMPRDFFSVFGRHKSGSPNLKFPHRNARRNGLLSVHRLNFRFGLSSLPIACGTDSGNTESLMLCTKYCKVPPTWDRIRGKSSYAAYSLHTDFRPPAADRGRGRAYIIVACSIFFFFFTTRWNYLLYRVASHQINLSPCNREGDDH